MPLPSLFDEIDRLFDELVHRPWGTARDLVPVELRAVEDGWTFELPVAGMRPRHLKVEVHGRRLTIIGHRSQEQEQQRGREGWSRSLQESSFHRSIELPPDADPEAIEAKIEGTTLSVRIPRRRHKR